MILRVLTMLLALALAVPMTASAQKAIKVGMPIPLSGPPALFGDPASKGAQMYVDELNAKGGVLGRKIELIVRDSKADANEAVRVAREMILKDNVDFLVGTLTSAEGPAVSVVAKENKIVFIAPIPKTDQLTAADKLHPYVFRIAANTTMEGRSAAEIVAKWPVTKVATIAFDYAYGQDVTRAFVAHIKTIKPSVQTRRNIAPDTTSICTMSCSADPAFVGTGLSPAQYSTSRRITARYARLAVRVVTEVATFQSRARSREMKNAATSSEAGTSAARRRGKSESRSSLAMRPGILECNPKRFHRSAESSISA